VDRPARGPAKQQPPEHLLPQRSDIDRAVADSRSQQAAGSTSGGCASEQLQRDAKPRSPPCAPVHSASEGSSGKSMAANRPSTTEGAGPNRTGPQHHCRRPRRVGNRVGQAHGSSAIRRVVCASTTVVRRSRAGHAARRQTKLLNFPPRPTALHPAGLWPHQIPTIPTAARAGPCHSPPPLGSCIEVPSSRSVSARFTGLEHPAPAAPGFFAANLAWAGGLEILCPLTFEAPAPQAARGARSTPSRIGSVICHSASQRMPASWDAIASRRAWAALGRSCSQQMPPRPPNRTHQR